MDTKKRYTFYITADLDRGLKALKERDGMPEAEALRRALAAYLKDKGVLGAPRPAAREKGGTRTGSK